MDLYGIDTWADAGADAAAAAGLAGLVLIPIQPAIFDLKAIGALVDVVIAARTPAFIVLNGTPGAQGLGAASAISDARGALEIRPSWRWSP